MIGLITTMLIYIIVLFLLISFLGKSAGDQDTSDIVMSCFVIVLLYNAVILGLNNGMGQSHLFSAGIPFLADLDRYGTLSACFKSAPGAFCLDFVELVIVTIWINILTSFLNFKDAGFSVKFLSKIILVLGGLLAYGAFMDMVRGSLYLTYAVYAAECFFTGASLIYTPAMVIAYVTGFNSTSPFVTYTLKTLPQTKIGKAFSSGVVSAVTFLIVLFVLEKEYGSVANVINAGNSLMPVIGEFVIMMLGFYLIIKSFFGKKDKKD